MEATGKKRIDLSTAISVAALGLAILMPSVGFLVSERITEARVERAEKDIGASTTAQNDLAHELKEINTRLARIEGSLSGATAIRQ